MQHFANELFVVAALFCCALWAQSAAAGPLVSAQPDPALQHEQQPGFDYSRFYMNKKASSAQNPANYADMQQFPGQWYASGILPRQLAPKFKRAFDSFIPNDKRLDEQLDSFYDMNMKPGRLEWNFNRL